MGEILPLFRLTVWRVEVSRGEGWRVCELVSLGMYRTDSWRGHPHRFGVCQVFGLPKPPFEDHEDGDEGGAEAFADGTDQSAPEGRPANLHAVGKFLSLPGFP